MEFLIGFALIAILMLFVGFGWSDIAILIIGIICVGVILSAVFFAINVFLLVTSRRVTAQFTRFDDDSRYSAVIYKVGDEELSTLFPRESVMRDKLYVPGKDVHVLYCKLRHAVFDKTAILTIALGSSIFIPAAVIVVLVALKFFHVIT